jgi:hypothetical protein
VPVTRPYWPRARPHTVREWRREMMESERERP